jgi:hypothetical protein
MRRIDFIGFLSTYLQFDFGAREAIGSALDSGPDSAGTEAANTLLISMCQIDNLNLFLDRPPGAVTTAENFALYKGFAVGAQH